MYNIQLEPSEQELSIPTLIARIANPPNNRTAAVVYESTIDFLRKTLAENEEADKRLANAQLFVDDAISKGWLRVTELFGKEIVQIDAMWELMFRTGGKVTQLPGGDGESYADAAKTRLLINAKRKGEKDGDGDGMGKNIWDQYKLRQLLDESNSGMTQMQLGAKYSVTRQRIARLLKNAKDQFAPKKAGIFDAFNHRSGKK